MLKIRCHFHPRYSAKRKSGNDCETCKLLYVLAHQRVQDQKELLVELGSKLATGDDGCKWEEALTGMEAGKRSGLDIRCRRHRYRATRKPGWNCDACWLLFVLKYQSHKDGERKLGGLNPYAYVIDFVDLQEACANFKTVN